MAKKKAAAVPKRQQSTRVERRTIIVLKGTQEYEQWLDSIADQTRMPASVIIDVALAEWAKSKGLSEPPKRLGGRL